MKTLTNTNVTMSSLELVEFINSKRKEGESELRHADFMAKVPKVLGEEMSEIFRSSYLDSMKREKPCYKFPKREACLMAMSYSYEIQAKVFDRMTELENQQQQKEQRTFNPLEKIGDITEQCLKIAHLYGFEGNQALISADKAVKTLTGYSPMQLIGATHLVAEVQAQMLNATELGRQLSPQLSAVKTNLILAGLGLQVKVEGKWEATEAGKPYSVYLDTSKKHSDGTPVKQLKWYTTVLPLLK